MAAKAVIGIENNSIKKRVSFIKRSIFPLKLYFFLCTKKIYWKKGKILNQTIIFFLTIVFFSSATMILFLNMIAYIFVAILSF